MNEADPTGLDAWGSDNEHYRTATIGLEHGLDHWGASGWHDKWFEGSMMSQVWYNGECAGLMKDPTISESWGGWAPPVVPFRLTSPVVYEGTFWDSQKNAFTIWANVYFMSGGAGSSDPEIMLRTWVKPNGEIGEAAYFDPDASLWPQLMPPPLGATHA